MGYSAEVYDAIAKGAKLEDIIELAHDECQAMQSQGLSKDEITQQIKKRYGFDCSGPTEQDVANAQSFLAAAPTKEEVQEAQKEAKISSPIEAVQQLGKAQQAQKTTSMADAFLHGYRGSITGMAINKAVPEPKQTASLWHTGAEAVGQMFGDLPVLGPATALGLLSGNPVVGAGVGFGTTESVRSILVQNYQNGKATTPLNNAQVIKNSLIAFGKGAAIGAITEGATRIAAPVAEEAVKKVVGKIIPPSIVKKTATTPRKMIQPTEAQIQARAAEQVASIPQAKADAQLKTSVARIAQGHGVSPGEVGRLKDEAVTAHLRVHSLQLAEADPEVGLQMAKASLLTEAEAEATRTLTKQEALGKLFEDNKYVSGLVDNLTGLASGTVGASAYTLAQSTMEGNLPTAEDFINAAVGAWAIHYAGNFGSQFVSTARLVDDTFNRFAGHWVLTGETPQQVRKTMSRDQEASENVHAILSNALTKATESKRVNTVYVIKPPEIPVLPDINNPEVAKNFGADALDHIISQKEEIAQKQQEGFYKPHKLIYSSKEAADKVAKATGGTVEARGLRQNAPDTPLITISNDRIVAQLMAEFAKTPWGQLAFGEENPGFSKSLSFNLDKYTDFSEGSIGKQLRDAMGPTGKRLLEKGDDSFLEWLNSGPVLGDALTQACLDPQWKRWNNDFILGVRAQRQVDNTGKVLSGWDLQPIKWAGIKFTGQWSGKTGTRYYIFDNEANSPITRPIKKASEGLLIEKAEAEVQGLIGQDAKKSLGEHLNTLKVALFDELAPLNKGAATGQYTEPYLLGLVSAGSGGRATHMIDYGMVNTKGDTIGPSLRSIVDPIVVNGGTLEGFSNYMLARSSRGLNQRGIATPIKPEAAATMVAFGQMPLDKLIRTQVKSNIKHVMKTAKLSKEERARYEARVKKEVEANYPKIMKDKKLSEKEARKIAEKKAREYKITGKEARARIEADVRARKPLYEMYEQQAQKLMAYWQQLIDYQKEAGLISNKKYDDIKHDIAKGIYSPELLIQAYAPELIEDAMRGKAQPGKATNKGWLQSFKDRWGLGSSSDKALFVNPLESIVRATYMTTRMAAHNDVRKAAGKMFGNPKLSNLPESVSITWFENGKKRSAVVPEDIAKACKSLEATDLRMVDALTRGMAKAAGVFRLGTTGHFTFAFKNLLMDQFTASFQTPRDVHYKPYISALAGLREILKTKWLGKESEFTDWLNHGGAFSSIWSQSRDSIAEQIKSFGQIPISNVIKEPWKYKQQILGLFNPVSWAKTAWHGMQEAVEVSDQMTRVGAYMAAKEAGRPKVEAANISRRSTVDFASGGSVVKSLNNICAFLNARVQGGYRFYETMKADPVGTTASIFNGVIIPSIVLAMAKEEFIRAHNNPDDEYFQVAKTMEQEPDWLRATYWTIAVPYLQTVLRIPKPQDIAAPFIMPWEAAVSYLYQKDTSGRSYLEELMYRGYLDAVYDNVAPGLFPTFAQPVVEVGMNYSLFTDQNIVPSHYMNLRPPLRKKLSSSTTARALSQFLDSICPDFITDSNLGSRFISPLGIDHLIRGWTGALGQNVTKLSDLVLEKTGIYDRGVRPETEWEKLPFVRAFTQTIGQSSKSIMEFNKRANRMQQTFNSIKKGLKSPDPNDQAFAQKLLSEKYYGNFTKLRQAMSNVSKTIMAVDANNQRDKNGNLLYTAEDKRVLISKLVLMQIMMADEGLKRIQQTEQAIKEERDARREQHLR